MTLRRLLTRYWGYLALVIAIGGFFAHLLIPAVVLALAVGALAYFLLQAPVWCGAETRAGLRCRRNSRGLLRGCSLREHKWQRVRKSFSLAGGKSILAAGQSAGGFLSLVGGVAAGAQILICAAKITFH